MIKEIIIKKHINFDNDLNNRLKQVKPLCRTDKLSFAKVEGCPKVWQSKTSL